MNNNAAYRRLRGKYPYHLEINYLVGSPAIVHKQTKLLFAHVPLTKNKRYLWMFLSDADRDIFIDIYLPNQRSYHLHDYKQGVHK